MSIPMTPYASHYSWYSPAHVTPPSRLKETGDQIVRQASSGSSLNNVAAPAQNDLRNKNIPSEQQDITTEQHTPNIDKSDSSNEKTSPDSELNNSTGSAESKNRNSSGSQVLTEEELRLVDQLKSRDSEVKAHEMAHIAAGGQYITSGARLNYQKGPDGINYAVGGEVSIDTSPIPGDPEATARKMRQVQQAALAPASPSSQDRKVASNAAAIAAKALSEMMILQVKGQVSANEDQAFGSQKNAAEAYAGISNISIKPQTGNLHTIA